MPFPPAKHSLILNRYKLRRKISADHDSYVYSARDTHRNATDADDTHRNDTVAVKVAPPHCPKLAHEKDMYRLLCGCPAVVRVLDHGRDCLVLERGKVDLKSLVAGREEGRVGLKTVLVFAMEMIANLEAIHSRGFIWRKLKPADVLFMGWPERYSREAGKGSTGVDARTEEEEMDGARRTVVKEEHTWSKSISEHTWKSVSTETLEWDVGRMSIRSDSSVGSGSPPPATPPPTSPSLRRPRPSHIIRNGPRAFRIIDLTSGIQYVQNGRHYPYAEKSKHSSFYSEFASVTQHLRIESSR
ncbi:hypothetical protein HK104_007227, partial [Borealophlyctis nickersoniae]